MGKRHPNYRLVKIHRNYSVEDIARLCGKHKNTVRAWLKGGLYPIDKSRPVLVHGQVLAAFFKGRRTAGKRPSPPGHPIASNVVSPSRPPRVSSSFRRSLPRLAIFRRFARRAAARCIGGPAIIA